MDTVTCLVESLPQQKHLALPMPVDEIHVWQVRVIDAQVFTEKFWQVLDLAEKRKVLRLRKDEDQTRSILSRGILRNLLGWYLSMEPALIEFSYNPMGKPFLSAGNGLEFNVAHSGELILFLFAFGQSVGIDVECVCQVPELQDLTRRFFSTREHKFLLSLTDMEQKKAFFKLWTLREAYGKMRGHGLMDAMKNVDIVSFLSERDHWAFETFAPLPEYAAAVVVERRVRRLVRFNGFLGLSS